MTPNARHLRTLSRTAIAALCVGSLISCGGHASGTTQRSSAPGAFSTATGHATIGALAITDGYIPQPASPDVAAAYLTITNDGGSADTIVTITTNVTKAVMAMNETDHDGVGSMTDLRAVTIPAHDSVSLSPGHAHLMLENPTSRLHVGQRVSVTITFAHAGTVTLTVPVVPLTGAPPVGTSPASSS